MDKPTNAEGGPDSPEYKDLSLPDLFEMFPDDQTAMDWLEANIWPDGRVCPRCGNKYTCVFRHACMPYYCSECDKRFSVKIGTVMEHSRIGYQNWAVAIYLHATHPKDISSVQLGRDLKISQSSAWFLQRRLREGWRTLAGLDLMAGPVEVDEAYLGGREKNKHADKNGRTKKTAVVGIRDRKTGTIRAVPDPETTAARLVQFVESNADPDSKKFTDENRAYNDLKNHQTVNHGDGEYVRGEVHINGMESFRAPDEERVQRDVPPHRTQAPAPLHQRVCGAAERQVCRCRRKDGQHCWEYVIDQQALPIHGSLIMWQDHAPQAGWGVECVQVQVKLNPIREHARQYLPVVAGQTQVRI